ncbi:MAG: 3-deoxy-D-manno-octulosonic acid kinase [Succinivibrio sp.]|nr:3-deoxy-D-manno-octulosonic acid kinase [Succinivibrio sp.]
MNKPADSRLLHFGPDTYYLGEGCPADREESYYELFFDPVRLRQEIVIKKAAGGRGQALLFEYEEHALISRHYLRGGLWGRLMGDKFCAALPGNARAADEFELLLKLRALGLPVPVPYLARVRRQGWYLLNDLCEYQLPDTQNLAEILATRELSVTEYQTVGQCLKRFFKAGVLHSDLNLRNILLNSRGECFVIDFDKCSTGLVGPSQAGAMLQRLERSFLKECRLRPDTHYNGECFKTLRESAELV